MSQDGSQTGPPATPHSPCSWGLWVCGGSHSHHMKVLNMTLTNEEQWLLELGVQYYVAARSAAMARLAPITGNLFHHSLEMLLKAGLSRQNSMDYLKVEYGHKLDKLWTRFKVLRWAR